MQKTHLIILVTKTTGFCKTDLQLQFCNYIALLSFIEFSTAWQKNITAKIPLNVFFPCLLKHQEGESLNDFIESIKRIFLCPVLGLSLVFIELPQSIFLAQAFCRSKALGMTRTLRISSSPFGESQSQKATPGKYRPLLQNIQSQITGCNFSCLAGLNLISSMA